MLREAEKPLGNAEAQADSRDLQPASESFFALCGRLMDLYVQWNILVTPGVGQTESITYFATKRKVEDIQPTGGTVVLSFLR